MPHYVLMMHQPVGPPPEPEVLEPIMRDLDALREEMRAAGAWVFSAGLHDPSTTTTLRQKDGEVVMTDGPYAEGHEHIGGFTVVEADDLDAALEWARRMAGIVPLPLEVRPAMPR